MIPLLTQLHQLREDRRSKTSDRIPPLGNGEASGVAATINAGRDVGEGLVANTVKPRVQETEWWFSSGDEFVIREGNDGGHERAGSTSSGDDFEG